VTMTFSVSQGTVNNSSCLLLLTGYTFSNGN
jgi:hypothetical protein